MAVARINELRQKRIEAEAAHSALLDAHLKAADGKRSFTSEEIKAQTEAEELVGGLDGLLKAEQTRIDIEKRRAETGPSRIEVGKPNVADDPRKGFRSSREVLMAAMTAAQTGRVDERLRFLAQRDPEDKVAAGEPSYLLPVAFTPSFLATVGSDEHGEYSNQYGGFSVMTTRLAPRPLIGFEGDPSVGRTEMIPMSSPMVEMEAAVDKDHSSSVSAGLTVSRRAETVALSGTRQSREMITLKASSLMGVSFATEELLADSPGSFIARLDNGFRTQFAAHIFGEKLRGKGAAEYLGVLTALASASLGPTISVAKEGSQVADTIVADNVVKMRSRCWGYSNAIWVANHDAYPQLVRLAITVGVGAATALYQQSIVEDRPDMLLGRPLFYSEYASTLGDFGDIGLYNFSQYMEGIYQPIQSAESVHFRFLNRERTFVFWTRNCGAPSWRTALTPNKSASTLSPFVLLAERA